MSGGIDDFIRQAEEDELQDAVQLPPIQYAKLRGIYPQKVYAAIRNHKLQAIHCLCGRKVVVIADADKFFGFEEVTEDEGDVSDSGQ